MQDITMGAVEAKFADIIWERSPVSSTDLWKEAERVLGWKKSTAFTVLKRLCDKGIFKNENGTVSYLISKEDFASLRSERFIDSAFDGSLPAFLTAFTKHKSLSPAEVEELRRLVADYTKE